MKTVCKLRQFEKETSMFYFKEFLEHMVSEALLRLYKTKSVMSQVQTEDAATSCTLVHLYVSEDGPGIKIHVHSCESQRAKVVQLLVSYCHANMHKQLTLCKLLSLFWCTCTQTCWQ